MVKGLLVKIEEPLYGEYVEVMERVGDLINEEVRKRGLSDLRVIKNEDDFVRTTHGIARYHCHGCHKMIHSHNDIIIVREGKEPPYGYFCFHYSCPEVKQ